MLKWFLFLLYDWVSIEKRDEMETNNAKEIINIDLDSSDGDSNDDSSSQQSSINESAENPFDNKVSKSLRGIFRNEDSKFMSNFDPESSNRKKRKQNRKLNVEGKKSSSIYDENGLSRSNGKDLCDCLNEDCVGCHFPCPKCRSFKCGVECRIHRKWMYESVENEGDKVVTTNPLQTVLQKN